MNRHTLTTVTAGTIVFGILAARAVHVAGREDFVPGIVHSFRTRFEMQSVHQAWQTPAGLISMSADLVRPGHADMGFFKFGPSTYLAVKDIRVACRANLKTLWQAGAETGQLDLRRLRLTTGVRARRGSEPVRCVSASIDLQGGDLVLE